MGVAWEWDETLSEGAAAHYARGVFRTHRGCSTRSWAWTRTRKAG